MLVSEKDSGKSFDLRRDDNITVILRENPTTGYRWKTFISEPGVLELFYESYSSGEGVMVGGGGQRKFIFNPKHDGKCILQFKKMREWEENSSAIEECSFSVVVKF